MIPLMAHTAIIPVIFCRFQYPIMCFLVNITCVMIIFVDINGDNHVVEHGDMVGNTNFSIYTI